MIKSPKYNTRVLIQWQSKFDEASSGMDTLEDYIRKNMEAIQATPMPIISVIRRATRLLGIFAPIPCTLEFRNKWTDIVNVIYSKLKQKLAVQSERELARTQKREAEKKMKKEIVDMEANIFEANIFPDHSFQTKFLSFPDDDMEAGAPEPKPKFDGRFGPDTKETAPKPNKKKKNERNKINGAKTNKKN